MYRYVLSIIAVVLLCAAANSAPVVAPGELLQGPEQTQHRANVAMIVSSAFDVDGKFQEAEANRGLEYYYSAAGLKFKK